VLLVIALVVAVGSAVRAVANSSARPAAAAPATPNPLPPARTPTPPGTQPVPGTSAAAPASAAAAPGSPSPSAAPTAPVTAAASASAVATAAATSTGTPTVATSAAPCHAADVVVSVAATGVGGTLPTAGSPVRLAVELASRSGCRMTVGVGAPPRLTVTSGADRVWDSGSCPVATVPDAAPGTTGQAVLLPAQAVVPPNGKGLVNIVWPGVRLAAGCTPATTALRPGTYTATVQLPAAPPATAVFTLR
jgi:hypothetical protein